MKLKVMVSHGILMDFNEEIIYAFEDARSIKY